MNVAAVGLMTVDALAFMAGAWVAPMDGGLFEETWSKPVAGTMAGHGRLVVDSKTAFMEFLSIETAKDGKVTMYIVLGALSAGDKKPVAFHLISTGDGTATFKREKADFPQTIRYTKTKSGLECLLTGPGEKPKTELYAFKPL